MYDRQDKGNKPESSVFVTGKEPSSYEFERDERKPLKSTMTRDESKIKSMERNIKLRKKRKEKLLRKRRKEDAGVKKGDVEMEKKLALLPQCVNKIKSGKAKEIDEALALVQDLTTCEDPPFEIIANQGFIPQVVKCLTCFSNKSITTCFSNKSIVMSCCTILLNFCSSNTTHTDLVMKSGGLKAMIDCVGKYNDLDITSDVVWAFGNIAGESTKHRDFVLKAGVLSILFNYMEVRIKLNHMDKLSDAVWTFSNLYRENPPVHHDFIAPALKPVTFLLNCVMDQIVIDVLWMLYFATEKSPKNSSSILTHKYGPQVLNELIGFLKINYESIQNDPLKQKKRTIFSLSLSVIGHLISTEAENVKFMIKECNILNELKPLLKKNETKFKKEVVWTISNIVCEGPEYIQKVIKCGIFGFIVNLYPNSPFNLKSEILYLISNTTYHANPNQMAHMLKIGCIKIIYESLKLTDVRTVLMAFEGLDNFITFDRKTSKNLYVIQEFEKFGGKELLTHLSVHDMMDVRETATNFTDEYFSGDSDDEEELEKEVDGGGQTQPNRYSFQQPIPIQNHHFGKDDEAFFDEFYYEGFQDGNSQPNIGGGGGGGGNQRPNFRTNLEPIGRGGGNQRLNFGTNLGPIGRGMGGVRNQGIQDFNFGSNFGGGGGGGGGYDYGNEIFELTRNYGENKMKVVE